MKSAGRWFWLFSGCLAVLTCLILLAIGGLLAWRSGESTVADLPARVSRATSTPSTFSRTTTPPLSTSTPEPTNTLVIQPGTPLPILAPPVRATTRSSSLTGIPTPTITGVSSRIKYETKFTVITYTVAGKTLDDISKALDEQAMPDSHEPGSRYYARTDWYLTGDWSWKTSPSGCEVANAQVKVVVTMTVPSLVAGEVAPDVQKRWDGFIENTIAHENGHVKLAYDGARNYQRELDTLAPAANCDILSNRLREMFRKNFDQIDHASTDYDKRTKHGETQGAVFP